MNQLRSSYFKIKRDGDDGDSDSGFGALRLASILSRVAASRAHTPRIFSPALTSTRALTRALHRNFARLCVCVCVCLCAV